MHDGTDRDRLPDWIDPHVAPRQLAHKGQLLVDLRFAEVAEVEMNVLTVAALEATTRLEFLHDGARHHVARSELGSVAHAVVVFDQEALVGGVPEVASLAARRLGHEYARARQSRRMVLNELHVFQPNASAIGERHAVARLHRRVRRKGEYLSGTTGAEDDRAAEYRVHLSAADIERGNSADATTIDQESRREVLVVADDLLVPHRVLKEGVQHVEPGLVGGVPGPSHAHAAEVPHVHPTVRGPAPGAAPVFELHELPRSGLDERLDRILVGEEVAALQRVVGVEIEAVVRPHGGGRASLR